MHHLLYNVVSATQKDVSTIKLHTEVIELIFKCRNPCIRRLKLSFIFAKIVVMLLVYIDKRTLNLGGTILSSIGIGESAI